MDELKEYSLFARNLAEISGKIIRSYFRSDITIDTKPDSPPLQLPIRKQKKLMRNIIMKNYPEHGIIGEEFGIYNEKAEYQWILDPIDGTKSFICGAITFGTLIALNKK